MRKKLGTFKLHLTDFDLFVDTVECGGGFTVEFETGRRSTMNIGLNSKTVVNVYETLLHETMEAALHLRGGVNRGGCGEVSYPYYYRFAFDHEAFQRAVNDASRFLLETQKLVYDEFLKLNPDAPLGV